MHNNWETLSSPKSLPNFSDYGCTNDTALGGILCFTPLSGIWTSHPRSFTGHWSQLRLICQSRWHSVTTTTRFNLKLLGFYVTPSHSPAPQVTDTVIRVFSTQTSESTTASCRRSVRHGLHSFGSCFPLIHPLSTLPLFLSSTVILTLEWTTERRGTGSLHLGMCSWKEGKERRKEGNG